MSKLVSFFMVCAILLSCNKKSDRDLDTSTLVAMEATEALIISTDIFHSCLRAGQHAYENSFSSIVNGGAIWSDTTSTTDLCSVDFGTAVISGSDSRPRTGKMIISSGSNYLDSLSFATIQLQSFSVSGSTSTGSLLFYSQGRNTDGNRVFDVLINSGSMFATNANSRLDWFGKLTFTWTSGESTPADQSDDVFSIEGDFQMAGGNSEVEISQIISYQPDCGSPTSGSMNVIPESISIRKIDFGNGSCDKNAIVLINGSEFEISFF